MEYFAGLDVSMKETSICVVDGAGSIVAETAVATEPEAIRCALAGYADRLARVGHEAGSLSPWLHRCLQALGLPVFCLETRHVHAALKAQRNKTDRNDARGIAQLVHSGWFNPIHVKSDASYRLRLLLGHRRTLKRKFLDLENTVRHSLKVFGIRIGAVGRAAFEETVRELVTGDLLLEGMTDSMLMARAALWQEYKRLHKLVVQFVARDPVSRRFMSVPGVGPVTALAFRTAIDDPTRFARSRDVGAYFGLTPKRFQSGTSIDWDGRISRQGDDEMRTLLYEAASGLLVRSKTWSSLKAWGLAIQRRRGHKKAVVAVARKLAILLHAMWRDGSEFRFGRAPDAPCRGAQTALATA
jgi:transposase